MLSLKAAVKTRRIRSFAVKFAVLGGIAIVLGFMAFLWLLPSQEVVLDRSADGIVVLTGVNPGTTTADIARQVTGYDRLLACCVDLDYSAINTLGNAVGTRRWAVDRGFRSLIIVTSAYHMPRARAEIAHQLPDVVLIPFPVVSDRLRIEPWWSNGATTRLVLSEYFKYLFAQLRMRLVSLASDAGNNRVSDARSPH